MSSRFDKPRVLHFTSVNDNLVIQLLIKETFTGLLNELIVLQSALKQRTTVFMSFPVILILILE